MAQQFTGPPKNSSDNRKLQIQGDVWQQGDWKRPGGLLRMVNNSIWLSVYPNHPDDQGAKPMNVKMGAEIGSVFLETLQEALDNPNFTCEQIVNKNYNWAGGQRSDQIMPMTKVFVERTPEGVIGIRVEERGAKHKPLLKFMPDRWFELLDGNGEPLDPGRVSQRIARGWLRWVRDVLVAEYVKNYEHKDGKKDGKSGGGNRGGGNRGGGSGGGWGNSSGGGGGDIFNEAEGF